MAHFSKRSKIRKKSIVQKYERLREEVRELAGAAGRDPATVALLVVSKQRSWEEMAPLYDAGVRLFGENRVQELLEKREKAPKDIQWHFIGPLQKNKVRKIIGKCACIHSVDSLELAKKIAECSLEANVTTSILIQVNTSGEISKQGLSERGCLESMEEILALDGLQIVGLMTMAPWTQNKEIIRSCFSGLKRLQEALQQRYGSHRFSELSMGMTNDYPIAIAEGTTILRLGSVVFD